MADILDETDLQILKTLQKNSKLTTKELADAVHLTPRSREAEPGIAGVLQGQTEADQPRDS